MNSQIYLESQEPILIINRSLLTHLLEPIHTRGIKEVLPLVKTSLLDIINLFLVTSYVPLSFKIAVTKPLLKKPTLVQMF